jgi:hypothetical protein
LAVTHISWVLSVESGSILMFGYYIKGICNHVTKEETKPQRCQSLAPSFSAEVMWPSSAWHWSSQSFYPPCQPRPLPWSLGFPGYPLMSLTAWRKTSYLVFIPGLVTSKFHFTLISLHTHTLIKFSVCFGHDFKYFPCINFFKSFSRPIG